MSRAKDEGSNGIFIRNNYSFARKLLGKIGQLSVDNATISEDGVLFGAEGRKTRGRRSCEISTSQKLNIPKSYKYIYNSIFYKRFENF